MMTEICFGVKRSFKKNYRFSGERRHFISSPSSFLAKRNEGLSLIILSSTQKIDYLEKHFTIFFNNK